MQTAAVRLGTIFAAFTVLGLFIAAANSLTYLSTGGTANWTASIKRSLGEWYLWAILTPFILRLSNLRPLERGALARNGAIHLAAGVSIAIAKVYLDGLFRLFLFGRARFLLAGGAPFNFLIYCALVAVAHGFRFYRMSREREIQASQLEARLAETRLMLLSMQLQPHFLFNTLNTISELVHEDPETADRMIAGLSLLLRETLQASSTPEVSLRRELELLRCYIEIQRARFGPRLQVTLEADPRAMDAAMPMLLLQPLVENAIRHGVNRRADRGCIAVDARLAAGRVNVDVMDDGPGLPAAEARVERTGLGNTRARLQALFGETFVLDVKPRAAGGTVVSISFPYRPVEAQ